MVRRLAVLLGLLRLAAGGAVWPPPGGYSAVPDAQLQRGFEPWRWPGGRDRWTGGDVGASAVLSPTRTLWVFGDTLLGHWNEPRQQRVNDAPRMPHSSVGVWSLDQAAGAAPVRWTVGPNISSFFRPSWESSHQAFWAAVATSVNGTVAVLGNRVVYTGGGGPFGFFSNETVIFYIEGAAARPDSPETWELSHQIMPHTGNCSGGAGWAFLDWAKGVSVQADTVYMIGLVQRPGMLARQQVLSRIPWSALRAADWSQQQFLLQSGWSPWTSSVPDLLRPLWAPATPELQPIYVAPLRSYVALDIPFRSTFVQLRTAPQLEGPWSDPVKLYDFPKPFNQTERCFCYSPLIHPSDRLPAPASRGFVFTYVCNGNTLADVYAPFAQAIYIPHFVRVVF